jgi:succinate-semialdehyde dehydrogenase/glutarate-semialdehyde dehydrogenase
LVSDKRIKGVSLTGSEAGKYCHGSRKTFEKVVLELGGNDVHNTGRCRHGKTVEWAVVGRMNNNGQCCVAQTVHCGSNSRRIYSKVYISYHEIGDPMDPATNLGPL